MNRSLIKPTTRIAMLAAITTLVSCANLAPSLSIPEPPIANNIKGGEVLKTVDNFKLEAWQNFFPDANARQLIDLALKNNRDLRIAAANVAEAQGMFQIQRQSRIPTLAATGSQSATGNSKQLSGTNAVTRSYGANVGLTSYELDFWGRVRNLNDAALASYFATLEAQRASKLTVIASTANAYSNWLAATQVLQLADQTLTARNKSYKLIELRKSIGVASSLDLAQAEVAKVTVEAQRAQSQRALNNAKAALELLVGTSINKVISSQKIAKRIPFNFVIPENLSSKLILSRPDVIAAEEALRAANANIGAARAAFLPSVTLMGSAGFASGGLSNLFKSDARTWSFVPSISIPLFGNSNKANLEIAKARLDKRVAEYEKVIQTAFSEVYRNGSARETRSVEIDANQRLVKAQQKRLSLATARYDAGLSNYIEVLDAKQNLFTSEQSLLESRRGEAESIIELYRALGGGDDLVGSFRSRLIEAKK